MSGLLALLDDVAGLAKVAAASVDDVAAYAGKAGAKAAGAVIDDAAVTPKYVHGFEASRELPIIWRITKGSLRNKLLFLLPAALLLSAFAPWLIAPLLMLGGAYLSFEGAEKIAHAIRPHAAHPQDAPEEPQDPAHLEEQKASGAIKTDFILSAEIMTIALSEIPKSGVVIEAATLAIVAVGITVVVYGAVALIVKADDVGLHMAGTGRLGLTRAVGRGLVRGMPGFLALLTAVGTAAMLWVGGSIIIHGLGVLGWHAPEDAIHHVAVAVAQPLPAQITAAAEWIVTAALDGVLAVLLGLILLGLGTRIVAPLWRAVSGKGKAAH
ncbi:DUF808 domain-containing protein [Antarcticimicrobium sediminis]|uniref:DUF808 domain-containing protein n=1 Tax=Antarcticimicrobium sediminis TaxID=2546227 RepID=A0A4R5EZ21_9RHOB|nr:DUF808 domain-containing protein [Antarcticimicrobium sediminis]TDE40378.1 DUF808 domain-containing protein [Antarcticimicrobium sediminis]